MDRVAQRTRVGSHAKFEYMHCPNECREHTWTHMLNYQHTCLRADLLYKAQCFLCHPLTEILKARLETSLENKKGDFDLFLQSSLPKAAKASESAAKATTKRKKRAADDDDEEEDGDTKPPPSKPGQLALTSKLKGNSRKEEEDGEEGRMVRRGGW